MIHVEGPRAIAKAAREAGVRHLAHISAIGADAKSSSRYARSKAEGEAAVLQEFPGAIVVRPSIVWGLEDQFFNRFAAMARISPLLPLIGRRPHALPASVRRRPWRSHRRVRLRRRQARHDLRGWAARRCCPSASCST